MATLLAGQASRALRLYRCPRHLERNIHACQKVQKSSPTAEISFPEDLFGDTIPPEDAPTESHAPESTSPAARKMSPELRQQGFDDLFNHLTKHTAERRRTNHALRATLWSQLFSLATTPGQLEQLAEKFPRWRENGREFAARDGDLFIRRCAELRCPRLAIQVFGDHSKYNMPLSLQGARHLLYTLHRSHEIEDTMLASTLYGVYRLPSINEDPASCAILVAACLLHPNEKTKGLAEALIPFLRDRLSKTRLLPPAAEPQKRGLDRPRAWLYECLRTIEAKVAELRLDGIDLAWAKSWMAENELRN